MRLRVFRLIIVASFGLLLSVFWGSSSAWAAGVPVPSDWLMIREGGADHKVTYDVPAGQMTQFGNGVDCGNNAHRTAVPAAKRFFNHYHISYVLPKTGVDDTGNPRTVTIDKVKDFWDNHYGANYTNTGGEDHKYNCWAYALGYDGIWIEDPSWIYSDDYAVTADYLADNRICPTGHVIKVVDVVCRIADKKTVISSTIEKNCASGIYKRSYDGGTTTDDTMRKHK